MVEEQICFSVLKCGYLKDLEAEFEKMRQARVPATENMDSYWFWKYARQ
jgi:hypothetical protein